MDVKFIKHHPCPSCGSRDNLGEWSDGHKWCFGCGYYEHGSSSLESVKAAALPKQQDRGVPQLPDDVSTYIPEIPYRWLKQYLTDKEILSHRIGWSNDRECIVFPVFDKQGNLLMWQSRQFGRGPKYLTKGLKGDILHILGNQNSGRVVVTEDLISAIVVSRAENAMPLWGAHLHLKTQKLLSRYYNKLYIWLDSDKLKEAIKARGEARLLFDEVRVISTEQDPKCYDKEQIERILGEGVDNRDKP